MNKSHNTGGIHLKENYLGYTKARLSDREMSKFYQNKVEPELLTNEYLIIENDSGDAVDFYRKNPNQKLERLKFHEIRNSLSGTIRAKNDEQKCAIDMLAQEDILIKVITGVFGSGKICPILQ